MNQSATADNRRKADLAMIHMAGKKLFGDVSRDGAGRADYEGWLAQHTGKSSARKLSRDERVQMVRTIRDLNILPDSRGGGRGKARNGADRPTSRQWSKLAALAKARGWDGLDDARLQGFVKRTAKIDNIRFMTRNQASLVITGLSNWAGEAKDAMP